MKLRKIECCLFLKVSVNVSGAAAATAATAAFAAAAVDAI